MDTSLLLYPTQDKVFVQSSSYLPTSPNKGREGDGNIGDFIQSPKLFRLFRSGSEINCPDVVQTFIHNAQKVNIFAARYINFFKKTLKISLHSKYVLNGFILYD
jgi:hypothetical protein